MTPLLSPEEQRQEFEAYFNGPLAPQPIASSSYEIAWAAWQAALRALPAVAAPLPEQDSGSFHLTSASGVCDLQTALPEGHVIAPHFRGYALMGAGAYLLTVCDGDERGPELVFTLATEEEKIGRTVGDLGDVVKGAEIPLERIAIRLQFASMDGLRALEQQLNFVRDELAKRTEKGATT